MGGSQYNIAHILPSPFVGGVEHATLRIAQAVEGELFQNVAFCPGESSLVKELFAFNGFDCVSYLAAEPSYRHPKAFLQASIRLAREFRRRKIDLIHCSDLLGGYYAGLAGKIARLPILCHIRCSYSNLSRRDRTFLHPIDKFVFVSRETWRHFSHPVPSNRGTVVYDGIDIDNSEYTQAEARNVRLAFNIQDGAIVIGMIARVTPAKDYPTLIKAARRVVAVEPNACFLIVGDYSQANLNRDHYEKVKSLLREDNLSAHFVFTDHRDDVLRMINAMDIFVLSTHTEGLPLSILEAMALAKPVVSTAVGGVPEVVINGETGLLHDHQDDIGLAAQLLKLLDDREFATRLGEAGRQFVKAKFNKEQFATSMINLYRDMLVGGSPRLMKGYLPRRFNYRYRSDIS